MRHPSIVPDIVEAGTLEHFLQPLPETGTTKYKTLRHRKIRGPFLNHMHGRRMLVRQARNWALSTLRSEFSATFVRTTFL